jgi:acetylornithine deacetylase/succinyl-diaminopimelate desuccinylase-like protein
MIRDTEDFLRQLRQRLSEPAMLELTHRLITIPSENRPGNQYEECSRTLVDELDRLGFDPALLRAVGARWNRAFEPNGPPFR